MTLQARRILSGTALAATIAVGSASAQTTYPNVKLTGRLHEQFYYFDNADYAATVGPKDNFFTRRARIEARGQISENVAVYIQPSFEGGPESEWRRHHLHLDRSAARHSASPAGPPAAAGSGSGTPGSTCASAPRPARARSTSGPARRSGPTAVTS